MYVGFSDQNAKGLVQLLFLFLLIQNASKLMNLPIRVLEREREYAKDGVIAFWKAKGRERVSQANSKRRKKVYFIFLWLFYFFKLNYF